MEKVVEGEREGPGRVLSEHSGVVERISYRTDRPDLVSSDEFPEPTELHFAETKGGGRRRLFLHLANEAVFPHFNASLMGARITKLGNFVAGLHSLDGQVANRHSGAEPWLMLGYGNNRERRLLQLYRVTQPERGVNVAARPWILPVYVETTLSDLESNGADTKALPQDLGLPPGVGKKHRSAPTRTPIRGVKFDLGHGQLQFDASVHMLDTELILPRIRYADDTRSLAVVSFNSPQSGTWQTQERRSSNDQYSWA